MGFAVPMVAQRTLYHPEIDTAGNFIEDYRAGPCWAATTSTCFSPPPWKGGGIACLPEFAVKEALESGTLQAVLTQEVTRTIHFSVPWPPNRFITPKLRCFVDFISSHM